MKFQITWPTGLSEFIEHEAESIDALAMSMWGRATAELVALEHRVLIALHIEKEAVETGAEWISAEAKAKLEAEAAAVEAEGKRLDAAALQRAEEEAAALAQQVADALKPKEQSPAPEGESQ